MPQNEITFSISELELLQYKLFEELNYFKVNYYLKMKGNSVKNAYRRVLHINLLQASSGGLFYIEDLLKISYIWKCFLTQNIQTNFSKLISPYGDLLHIEDRLGNILLLCTYLQGILKVFSVEKNFRRSFTLKSFWMSSRHRRFIEDSMLHLSFTINRNTLTPGQPWYIYLIHVIRTAVMNYPRYPNSPNGLSN